MKKHAIFKEFWPNSSEFLLVHLKPCSETQAAKSTAATKLSTPPLCILPLDVGVCKPQALMHLPTSALQQSLGVPDSSLGWQDSVLGTVATGEPWGSWGCQAQFHLVTYITLPQIFQNTWENHFLSLIQKRIFFSSSFLHNFRVFNAWLCLWLINWEIFVFFISILNTSVSLWIIGYLLWIWIKNTG